MNKTVLMNHDPFGFLAIVLLSFLLGVAVTIFCHYLKKGQDLERHVSD